MNKLIPLIAASIAACIAPVASAARGVPPPGQATDPLFDTISALDAAVFDAFNHCSVPEQL